ncbi:MAG: glycosyltransferase [Endomicrobium sp.]|jgi:processive 1,2-diacylglycerol beta-glucosyltransferase|nr:glycosyltransferase [Endomicrobium sp.]
MEKQKRILILTSYLTGHGHASITSAVEDALRERNVDFKTVEAYGMCSKTWLMSAKSYGRITRNYPKLWEFLFNFAAVFPGFVDWMTAANCKRKFLKTFKEYMPDTIVSIHPIFVGSILGILEKNKLPCRFITVIADLVSISPLWTDKRADLTICPTRESLAYALRKGISPDKLEVVNLPTRSKITKSAGTVRETGSESGGPVKLFMMSGGEGSGDMAANVRELLKVENSRITVIAGRNARLEKSLKDEFGANSNVEIHGFVNNIDELLPRHDIAIVRGSPNVLMECVNLTVPVIVTDYLGGQEPGNVDFIITRKLGLFCFDKSNLNDFVKQYLKDGRKLLKETRRNQFEYRDLDAAKKIAGLI